MHSVFLVFLLCWALFLSPASAQVRGADEITVHAQAQGDSALLARTAGLKQAERAALLKVLEQRHPQRAAKIMAKLREEDIGQLVSSFDVAREQSTAHAYEADITYRFDREQLDRLIAEERGLIPSMESDALFILPMYQMDKKLLLWEPENLWRSQLNVAALQQGRGNLVMPTGDPHDKLAVDHAVALSGDRAAMIRLAERYGAKNVVIAQAHSSADADGTPHVQVILRHVNKAGGKAGAEAPTRMEYAPTRPGETLPDILERAAREVTRDLAETRGRYSLFADEEAQQVKGKIVRAEYRHNRDWMQIKQALDGLPHVDYVDMGAVSPDFAQLTLYFRGSEAAIRQALLTRGMSLRDEQGYWLISMPE